jgi:C4-dicarboxylate-specific signal transduction histidine kinase
MTRVTLIHVSITGTLLGVVTHLFVQSTSIDPEAHVRVLEVIDSLSQAETDLRRNLLLVRGDLLLHYDTVNGALGELRERLDDLRLIASASTAPDSEALSGRFALLEANVAQDEELVEQFKWHNALLRNSWSYFAQKSRSVSRPGALPVSAGEGLSRTIDRLLPAMMLVQHQPRSEATELAALELDRLAALDPPTPLGSHVDSMVKHGRLILRLSPTLDASLKTLLTSRTAGYVNDLRSTYLDQHRRSVNRAENHRVLLYAASLLLLAYLAFLFIRLQSGSNALALSNAGLKKEMSERRQAEDKARALQAELAHAHRLSLMGEMASGLAHELNQPLTAIRLYARGCVRRLKSGDGTPEEILDAMNRLSAQVLRAGEILGWIRSFVKKRQPCTSAVDINALIRETVELLSYERRNHDFSIELGLTGSLPCVKADKIEVQQVILNLTRNSMEAMDERPPEPLRIVIRTATGGGGMIEVVVEDSGRGMTPDVLAHAFDSFFTTKPQGMGLGLAISRSMVEAQGGQLWATSQEGVGTTVHFTLPVAGEESNDSTERDGIVVEFGGSRSGRVEHDDGRAGPDRRRIHGDSLRH